MYNEITFLTNEEKFRFEAILGDDIAYVDYKWDQEILVLKYIFVPPQHRGKGVSEQLMKFVLDLAAEQNLKIKVYCSHIANYIRLHPGYHHLAAPAYNR